MRSFNTTIRGGHARVIAGALLAAAALAASHTASAQTAAIYGSLGNFDVANYTGHDACGFEVDVSGVTRADISGGFGAQRYGDPLIEAHATGVKLTWKAAVNASVRKFFKTGFMSNSVGLQNFSRYSPQAR